MERRGHDGLNAIMGVTKSTVERNIIIPMQRFYGDLVGNINSKNVAIMFGEEVHCLGAEKINQVSKIQGATFKYIYGDEVAKWAEAVFNFMKSRLRAEDSLFDGTLNPESQHHYLYKFLYESPELDVYNQHYTIDDNPFYPEKAKEELKKEYAGTVYYDRLILGLWKQADGLIYRLFADAPQQFLWTQPNLPRFVRITIGVDWGGSAAAHAFVACGITPRNELFFLASEHHVLPDAKPQEIDELAFKFYLFVREKYGKYGTVTHIFPDNENISLCNGLKAKFITSGVHVRNTEKERINDRIQAVRRVMGAGKLWYTEDAYSLRDAFSQAMWDKEESIKQGKDVRLDDGSVSNDLQDAAEYSFQYWIRDFDRR